ncbi:LytTR family DNA-binding domain-containing protein [Bacteroides sp. 519]|uniref:LytTR family DNA-binding domain-containing protein n=1 Tax=Bacteroides sp. 519 TaxID=2302937 RepID=UPI0013D29240|nr:LytTR family DNA-binding domain-containing protein [Bacteroides sp. 519]NDV60278.1 LytTR family transcriptional regulator [Bacteroides sp. 519]
MNRIWTYLNQPAPLAKKPWLVVVVSSLLIFFLLGVFQPFGLNAFEPIYKWLIISGFAFVTAISTGIIGYIFPVLFKRFYNPENWTYWKSIINIFIIMLVIGLGNFFFDWILTNRAPETFFPLLRTYLIITFLIGLIPAIISTIIIQNKNLRQNLSEARELNRRLAQNLQENKSCPLHKGNPILLSGSTKDEIELYPENIIYIEALGNYVVIHYLNSVSEVKQKQLRTTITLMEKTLESFAYLVKCHRAFIVNTLNITNIEGNSQGFLLNLCHTQKLIPVSRTYSKDFRKILSARN